MNPPKGLSSGKEEQLSGGLKAYYSEPKFSPENAKVGQDSHERMFGYIGMGLVILYYITIYLLNWDNSSLQPWIVLLGFLGAATFVGIALTTCGSHHRVSIGRNIIKALGIPFVILAALIWNVAEYGLLMGVLGALLVSTVVFLSLLWTMSGWHKKPEIYDNGQG